MEISAEKEKEAKSNFIPKLNLSGDYRYFFDQPYQMMPKSAFGGPEGLFQEIQFGTPHSINAGIQAAMPLYNPQIFGAIKATKTASEISKLQYRKAKEDVIINISNLYYNAQVLKHQLAFIDSNLINTTKLLNTMLLLQQQQLAKSTDVEKIRLQKNMLAIQRKTVAGNLEQVLNLLKLNMGIPYKRKLDVESTISYVDNTTYQHNMIVDLQLATTRIKLLNSELKTLKNSRLPSISAYGSYMQTGFGYNGSPESFLKFFPSSFAGIRLSMPIFNGMVTKKKIAQKKIEIRNSELQVSLLNEQNDIQIENAKRQRATALENITNTRNQIKLARSIYHQTLLQQKEGLASITDVLMADNSLREAQKNNITAIVDYLKADLELKKLTGNIDK